jgi:hypothetical protein
MRNDNWSKAHLPNDTWPKKVYGKLPCDMLGKDINSGSRGQTPHPKHAKKQHGKC